MFPSIFQAYDEGVVLYSEKSPDFCSVTQFDSEQKVTSCILPSDVISTALKIKDIGRYYFWKKEGIILSIITGIILIAISLLLRKDFWTVYSAIWFSVFASYPLFNFVNLSVESKSKKGSLKERSRINTACQKALHAYAELGRVPTTSEAKKASPFMRAGNNNSMFLNMFQPVTMSIVLLLFGNHTIALMLSLVAVAAFTLLARRYHWLACTQFFFMSKPSEKDLELAIKAIESFEAMEKKIAEGGPIMNEIS